MDTRETISVKEWTEAIAADQVKEMTEVTVKGKSIAVFKYHEQFYALANCCSHQAQPLLEGEFWNGTIYCPRHGSGFDIKTGDPMCLPATKPVKSYPVKVENGIIYIGLD